MFIFIDHHCKFLSNKTHKILVIHKIYEMKERNKEKKNKKYMQPHTKNRLHEIKGNSLLV